MKEASPLGSRGGTKCEEAQRVAGNTWSRGRARVHCAMLKMKRRKMWGEDVEESSSSCLPWQRIGHWFYNHNRRQNFCGVRSLDHGTRIQTGGGVGMRSGVRAWDDRLRDMWGGWVYILVFGHLYGLVNRR